MLFTSPTADHTLAPEQKIWLDATQYAIINRYASVSECAAKNRYLSSMASSRPGPYDPSLVPYLREIVDAIRPYSVAAPVTRRPRIIVLVKGTQVGATDAALNIWLYHALTAPGPDAIMLPSVELARRLSKDKIQPMIDYSDALRGLISERTSEIRYKKYPDGSLRLLGANSPIETRLLNLRLVIIDEVDAMTRAVRGEGSPIMLVLNRQATYPYAQTLMISSPTLVGESAIREYFDQTDQRVYELPCRCCGGFAAITWDEIEYDSDDPGGTAVRKCPLCGHRQPDSDKAWMLPRGRWRATVEHPVQPDWAGYWLPSTNSPWESFGELASLEVASRADPERQQVFWNTKRAEPWVRPAAAESDPKMLLARQEDYAPEVELPPGVVLLTAAIDVQGDRLEVLIDGWGRDEECWNIAHRQIFGDPTILRLIPDTEDNNNVWARARRMILREWKHPRYPPMRPMATCVDTGGLHTQQAYHFVRMCQAAMQVGFVWGIKGRDGRGKIWPERPTQVALKKSNRSLKIYLVRVESAKDHIHAVLQIPTAGAGYRHFPRRKPGEAVEFFAQLTAERLIEKRQGGHPIKKWVHDQHPRNEIWDLTVYSYIALLGLGDDGNFNLNDRADEYERRFPAGERTTLIAEGEGGG